MQKGIPESNCPMSLLLIDDSKDLAAETIALEGRADETAPLPYLHEPLANRTSQDPPSLEYELNARRKKSIAINMSVIAGVNTLAPTLIFFLYKHLAGNYRENPALTYTWVTLALGTLELFQWPYRSYLLCKDGFARSARPYSLSNEDAGRTKNQRRKRRRKRSRFRTRLLDFLTLQDFFGMQFFLCIVIGAVCLTLCCSLGGTRGSFPLLVMSIPSIVLYLGLVLAFFGVCTARGLKTPSSCWISSLPPNSLFRPAVYFIIEDIVAVEGGGAYAYRQRLSRRYESSPPFRRLMQELNSIFVVWSLILFAFALACTLANVCRGFDEDATYGAVVVFSVLWSALVATLAWRYSQRSLDKEADWWRRQLE